MLRGAALALGLAPGLLLAQPAERFPGASWEMRSPEEAGMSGARLEEALRYAAGPQSLRSHCVSIHRNGFLVAEGYWTGRDPSSRTMVYSVSKTFATALIGAAERDGLVDTEERASSRWIPEWRGTESEDVTLDMVLRHDSGRYYGSGEPSSRPSCLPILVSAACASPRRANDGQTSRTSGFRSSCPRAPTRRSRRPTPSRCSRSTRRAR